MSHSIERENLLRDLDALYEPIFNSINADISALQLELSQAQGSFVEKQREINAYYDALEEKERAEDVISKGAPTL